LKWEDIATWLSSAVVAVTWTWYYLFGRNFVRAEFLTGILAFDAILLVIVGFSLQPGTKIPWVNEGTSANLLVLIILASAISSAEALLSLAPIAPGGGLAFDGTTVTSVTSIFSTGWALFYLFIRMAFLTLNPVLRGVKNQVMASSRAGKARVPAP
jgi:hypothetical protein